MAVMRIVVSMPCQVNDQVSLRLNQASTKAPMTPIAPASVAVAKPMKMVPSTMKISASEGIMPRMQRLASAQPFRVRASGGSAGMSPGRRRLKMKTQAMNSKTWMTLAPMAPMYIWPTGLPS